MADPAMIAAATRAAGRMPADDGASAAYQMRQMLEEIRRGNMAVLKELRKERGEDAELMEQWYVYTDESNVSDPITGSVLVPAGGRASWTATVSDSSVFYACYITNRSPLDADPTSPNQPYTWHGVAQSDDLQWSNRPLHSDATTGSGERPHFFPRPRILREKTQVQIEFLNLNPADDIRVFFNLGGWKIYFLEKLVATARQ